MIDLKPCPFCGGKAQYNEKKLRIECSKCKAQMPGVLSFKGVWNYKYYLADLWNRRVDSVQTNDYEIVLGGFHDV